MLGCADAVGIDTIGSKRFQMLVQLVCLALRGGIGRGVEVYADVHFVVGKIGKLLGKLVVIGEIRAVDRIGHAVFQTAADQIVDAVAVDVRHHRHAVVAEFGVVVALVVEFVQFDKAVLGEAALPVAAQDGNIAVKGADQQIGLAVLLHIIDARGQPVAGNAGNRDLRKARGRQAVRRAIQHQQLPGVRAANQIGIAVAVDIAPVGQHLRAEAGVRHRARSRVGQAAQTAEQVDLAICCTAQDIEDAVAVPVAGDGRGIAGNRKRRVVSIGQRYGGFGQHAVVIALAAVKIQLAVRRAADQVERAVAIQITYIRIGTQVIFGIILEVAAAVLNGRLRQPCISGSDMRAGGIGVFVQIHGKRRLVRAFPKQSSDGFAADKPGIAVAHDRVGWDLRIFFAKLGKGDTGAVGIAAQLFKMQLPAHGGSAERAIHPPSGKTCGAFQIKRRERVFQQARRAQCRIREVLLRLVALYEHRAADAVRVGQQTGSEQHIALAVFVDGGQGKVATGAQRHRSGGLHADAAVQPFERFKIVIGAVQRIEILGDGLHLLQVAVHLGIGHIMRISFQRIELFCTDKVPVKEIVKPVGQEYAAACLGKGLDILAQVVRICGVHNAFVRVQQVVVVKRKRLRYIHRLGRQAKQQRLAQARVKILP